MGRVGSGPPRALPQQHLLEQALRHYGASFRVPGLPELHDATAPRAALLQVFELAIAGAGGGHEPCLLSNTALELGRPHRVITMVLEVAFENLVTRFREAIERAQDAREIAAGVDAVHTAHSLLGLYLGLCVLVRASVREQYRPTSSTFIPSIPRCSAVASHLPVGGAHVLPLDYLLHHSLLAGVDFLPLRRDA